MIRKSFLKIGTSNNLDGSEDDYLWNGCEEGEGEETMLMNISWDTDKDHGTLIKMCHKNIGKNCLVTVKIKKKTILKVFDVISW